MRKGVHMHPSSMRSLVKYVKLLDQDNECLGCIILAKLQIASFDKITNQLCSSPWMLNHIAYGGGDGLKDPDRLCQAFRPPWDQNSILIIFEFSLTLNPKIV